ncbi:MAG: hypothetical protein P4L68_08955 [Methylovirgula sp.]|nr:hypothetical protein [Methylovirgula sp.]
MSAVKRFRLLAIALLAFAVGGVLGAFYLIPSHAGDDSDSDNNPNPPVRLTIRNGVPTLTLTTEEQENAGIIAARLEPAPPKDDIHGFATVLDPAGLVDLSNQYRDAEAQVAVARARLAASQAVYQRAQILHKDQQNVSTAQLQSAESTYDVDTDTLAAVQTHATAVIANARQAWGEAIATALARGDSAIADLIERRAFLVRVTLPPGAIITTPPATASALYGPSDVRLTYVSLATTTDPKLQGMSYLYRTPAQSLLPGLTLDVALPAKSAQRGSIVPDSAVVWLEGRAWIYIRTQPTIFIRQQIDLSRSAPRNGYIVGGLAPDARVVIHGTQMLLSEEFRASVPVED